MITFSLIAAIMVVESGGRVDAVSRSGAHGVMQLMPIAMKEVSNQYGLPADADRFDPNVNVRYGVKLLKYYAGNSRNVSELLASWNGGFRQVRKMRAGEPLASETKGFISKVLAERKRMTEDTCAARLSEDLCRIIARESRPGGQGFKVSKINYGALPL